MSPEKLGQHFLTDTSWHERIARAVRIDHGVWVEIGAGHGEMTTRLAQSASNVFAIELDPRLAMRLREVTRIAAIHIVIQFEVAVRIVAQPGRREYGYLSVVSQWFSRPGIAFRIPPGAFRPPPKVASALVSFRMPGARAQNSVENENAFLNFVKECFAQKRKTLRNNLRARLGTRTEDLLREAGLSPDVRAEQLAVSQFVALFRLAR